MTADLITRLEKLEGPCRECDWAISEWLGDIPEHTLVKVGCSYGWYREEGEYSLSKCMDGGCRDFRSWSPPKYTSSLDAIVGLIEREGFDWSREDRVMSVHERAPFPAWEHISSHHKTAIALAVCYCKAKAAREIMPKAQPGSD